MRTLFAAAVPLALAGCAQPDALPLATPLLRAADPGLAHPAPAGPAVTHTRRSIEEPGDWRPLTEQEVRTHLGYNRRQEGDRTQQQRARM